MRKSNQYSDKIQDHLHSRVIAPSKLFVYWQLMDEKIRFICKYFYIPDEQLILTLRLNDHASGKVVQEVVLRQGVSSWLFKGIKPNVNYMAELGIRRSSEAFFPLLKSNVIIQDVTILKNEGKPNLPGWVGKVSTYTYYENLEGSSSSSEGLTKS